jgi:phosphopantetheinyl transferase
MGKPELTAWRLWGQILSTREAGLLPQDPAERNAVLLRSLVRRKALLKAAGVGLGIEPRAIELTPEGGIHPLPLELGAPAAWRLLA